ncbi:glycosyltransferase family 2 protein [Capnocytophaga cynodegmi]|uniref:Glycosyltransferase, group 2 family protein n=1 Tax=Capnocytophaga cynodegmi TaxID=28189 RepID=A0A0B7HK26_9FLAO|nr:glycosyltransferase family A protein [Capnocytophaga cynodegmi]CEN38227.1 Glycosyltransferase, group 2 family protein [Capnocytophaga cynodegmi]
MNPLVSVIIPIYNVENFVEETILSVLQQSYSAIELILIDDGSTDGSTEVCQKYSVEHNVVFISQTNRGVSVTRNRGIQVAKGDYIYFLDSDDTIEKDFIKTSVKVAEQGHYDIIVVGEYYGRRFPDVALLPTCALFLRKSLLEKFVDIRFPEGIQPCEDGIFSHQLLALTNKIGFNPKGIYHYRMHENQNHKTIIQQTTKILTDIPLWLSILNNFYVKRQLFEQKSLHLALFLQYEPFDRYLKMPFTEEQKKQLFDIINNFYNKNVAPYITEEEFQKLNKPFRHFIKAENHKKFDLFFERYTKFAQAKECIFRIETKIKLFLLKFVPIKKIRKQKREKIRFAMRNRPEL